MTPLVLTLFTLYASPLSFDSKPPLIVPNMTEQACRQVATRLQTLDKLCPAFEQSSSTSYACPIPKDAWQSVECIKSDDQ